MKKELLKLIEKGESENLEFKEGFCSAQELAKEMCAFANSKGGTILFGVKDKGEKTGIRIKKNIKEHIITIASNNLSPKIIPKISLIDNVVKIDIPEGSDKPYSANGLYYLRVGPISRQASRDELLDLMQRSGKIQFDSQICEEATLDDVDWDKVNWFKSVYKAVTGKEILTDDKRLLDNLKCTKEGKITNAGVLLFGKLPEKFIPQNQITIVRYPGNKVSDRYSDIKDFYGNLFELIDNADSYIRDHIQIASKLTPGQIARQDIPQYPLFAIRELIVNAVAHRDYLIQGSRIILKLFKNRIEFSSPGGFPSDITPENIIDRQYSRNPILVKVLNKVKYIEAIGDGIDRVFDAVKNHPLKPKLPLFKEVGNNVIVTLYSADMNKLREEGLNERQRKAIVYLKEKGRITNREYRDLFNVSKHTAIRDLDELVEKKIVEKRGAGRTVHYILRRL